MDPQEFEDVVASLERQQPTRIGRTREARRFDQTQLKANVHGKAMHRDYVAHFLRWCGIKNHVLNHHKVLDIGCGQEQPLSKVLEWQQTHVPDLYVGVDLNKIPVPNGHYWAKTHEEFNFVDRWVELTQHYQEFDFVVCLEVIEHMHVEDGAKLLAGVHTLLEDRGIFFLSTPVFSGKAAVNHCHEYTIPELKQAIEAAGFRVLQRYGTFGNVRDLEPVLTPEEAWCWNSWRDRLGNDGLSVLFATNHPDQSRNNLWMLCKS